VRVAMQKVPGVASVRVSLNEGLTVLDLKPGNDVTLSNLRRVIRNNGFVTKEAQVVAVGAVSTTGAAVVFEVSGTRERFSLQPGSGQQLQRFPSGPLALTGSVDITDPKSMKITVAAVAQP
jgi:hypothetical protein